MNEKVARSCIFYGIPIAFQSAADGKYLTAKSQSVVDTSSDVIGASTCYILTNPLNTEDIGIVRYGDVVTIQPSCNSSYGTFCRLSTGFLQFSRQYNVASRVFEADPISTTFLNSFGHVYSAIPPNSALNLSRWVIISGEKPRERIGEAVFNSDQVMLEQDWHYLSSRNNDCSNDSLQLCICIPLPLNIQKKICSRTLCCDIPSNIVWTVILPSQTDSESSKAAPTTGLIVRSRALYMYANRQITSSASQRVRRPTNVGSIRSMFRAMQIANNGTMTGQSRPQSAQSRSVGTSTVAAFDERLIQRVRRKSRSTFQEDRHRHSAAARTLALSRCRQQIAVRKIQKAIVVRQYLQFLHLLRAGRWGYFNEADLRVKRILRHQWQYECRLLYQDLNSGNNDSADMKSYGFGLKQDCGEPVPEQTSECECAGRKVEPEESSNCECIGRIEPEQSSDCGQSSDCDCTALIEPEFARKMRDKCCRCRLQRICGAHSRNLNRHHWTVKHSLRLMQSVASDSKGKPKGSRIADIYGDLVAVRKRNEGDISSELERFHRVSIGKSSFNVNFCR